MDIYLLRKRTFGVVKLPAAFHGGFGDEMFITLCRYMRIGLISGITTRMGYKLPVSCDDA